MCFAEAATEEQISEFEKAHEVCLPEQYKNWLLFSDGGECFLPAGVQLYGIAHKPIINVDDGDRPNENYVVIGALSSGDPILCEESGTKISIFNHENGRIEPDEVCKDFYSFLRALHDDVLGLRG